jgi:hypothetical protein
MFPISHSVDSISVLGIDLDGRYLECGLMGIRLTQVPQVMLSYLLQQPKFRTTD